jgi:hypothetical protein
VKRAIGWSVPPLARDLVVLVVAVVIGGLAGALANALAYRWTSAETGRNIALAAATTITGATHARLVHRQSLKMVVPGAAVSLPVVYVAMRIVHLLVAP